MSTTVEERPQKRPAIRYNVDGEEGDNGAQKENGRSRQDSGEVEEGASRQRSLSPAPKRRAIQRGFGGPEPANAAPANLARSRADGIAERKQREKKEDVVRYVQA